MWVDDKDASRPKAARSDFDERRVRFGVDSRGLIIVVGAPDGLGHQLEARWRDKNSTEFINKEPLLGATSLLTLLTLPSQNVISTPKNHQHNLNCWNLDLGLCRKDFEHFQLQTKLQNLIPSWHSIHCNTWPQLEFKILFWIIKAGFISRAIKQTLLCEFFSFVKETVFSSFKIFVRSKSLLSEFDN